MSLQKKYVASLQSLTELLKSISIYFIAGILNALIPFFLLPILTKYLNTDDYGILVLINTFVSFTLPFINLAISGSVNVQYFKLEREQFSSYVYSSIVTIVASSLLFSFFYLVFGTFFQSWFKVPYSWLLFVPFICLTQVIPGILLGIFQINERPLTYSIFQISQTIFQVGLALCFVVLFKWSWEGRMLSIFISQIIFCLLSVFILLKRKFIRSHFSWVHVRELLKFGVPLIPHMISSPVLSLSDRFFISKMISLNEVGLYSLAYQLGFFINTIAFAFNQAWIPYLFKNLSDIDENKKFHLVKISYLSMLVITTIGVIIYFILPLIFNFFIDQKFHSALHYVPWILLGGIFNGFYYVVVNYVFFIKKTLHLATVTFGGSILSLLLNVLLIPKFGAIGAAYSCALANFIIFVSVWILSNKLYPMPWLKVFIGFKHN